VEGTEFDLHAQPYNVKPENDEKSLDSPGSLPETLVRIFHPTAKGHESYRRAFVETYSAHQETKNINVKCKGLKDNNYAMEASLSELITNYYCPKLAGMSDSIDGGH
jgi:hypothetical protein